MIKLVNTGEEEYMIRIIRINSLKHSHICAIIGTLKTEGGRVMAQRKTANNKKGPSQVRRAVPKNAGIYFNDTTKKYDVKYNYKVYDPDTGKNKYKQKWKYNLRSLEEAKMALADLRSGGIPVDDKEITLEGIYKVWLKKAEAGDLSVNSIRHTESQLKIIYEFLPKETKLKNITGAVYDDLFSKLRAKELDKGGHYSEETLHSVDSCLHKLMKLAWK